MTEGSVMTHRNVLIAGAGIAGPALAHWLDRHGMRATLVERASALREGGQAVDLRGAGRDVAREMGLPFGVPRIASPRTRAGHGGPGPPRRSTRTCPARTSASATPAARPSARNSTPSSTRSLDMASPATRSSARRSAPASGSGPGSSGAARAPSPSSRSSPTCSAPPVCAGATTPRWPASTER
ncbi:FAD-dependent monooxygenase [Streptomyces griseus]|uniref:FAD-dependent monooxygenase n=1 Tax=Streptomyces griseus TaxID=1911 RepID=UPI00369C2DB7